MHGSEKAKPKIVARLVQEKLFAGEHLPDYLETQIMVGRDLVYAGRDFSTRSGTAIVLHTNSDFGCVT